MEILEISMLKNDAFLKACRYMKEYQAIRKRVDFLTMCKTPELAAQATLLPIDILGVDAAILFSDILIPVEAMGMEVRFTEEPGPVFSAPIRSEAQVQGLSIPGPAESEERMSFITV